MFYGDIENGEVESCTNMFPIGGGANLASPVIPIVYRLDSAKKQRKVSLNCKRVNETDTALKLNLLNMQPENSGFKTFIEAGPP